MEMQKKNQEILQLPTPSNEQPSIQTGQEGLLPNQMPGNTVLPSPSVNSTSELAPSTSDSSVPPVQKVSQNVLNTVVRNHISKSKFQNSPELTDKFLKNLEKYGYSPDQIEKARIANTDVVSQVEPENDPNYHPTTETQIKSDENFSGSFLGKSQSKISDYVENQGKSAGMGASQMFQSLKKVGKDVSSSAPAVEKLGDIGSDVLNAAAGGLKTAFAVGGLVSPQLASFNAATEMLHSIPDQLKASMVGDIPSAEDYTGKNGAEKFDKIIDFPFTAASTIAKAMGRDPKQGSTELAVYDILNVLIPLGAHKAFSGGSGAIKDINDLKDIAAKVQNGEATEGEIKSVVDLSNSIKDIPIDDVKEAVVKQKLDKYIQIPNEDIIKASIHGETPETVRAKVDEISSQIKEEQDPAKQQELMQNQEQLHALADAMEVHEDVAKYPQQYVDAINSDETIPAEQKKVYIDQITNSAQLDAGIQNVEQAKVDHISDIEALKDPGSKEFYDKAMQALDDPGIIDQIKKSLDGAVKAGEITLDEANENYAHFEKLVDIDKTIPDKISDPEDRIEASKLIEKKRDIKESVQGKDSVLAEKEIESAKVRTENIDNKLKEIVDQAKEKKESPGKRVHAIWKNALLEMKDENLKKGIQEKGIEYIIKKEAVGEASAREVVDAAVKADKLGDLENIVLDNKNGMDGTNRGVISALLGNHYFELSKKAVDVSEKQSYQDKFYNYTKRAAELATEGGQSGNAIGKIIKKLYVNDPESVITEYKMRMDKANEKILESHQEQIQNTYKSIQEILATEEGQNAITEELLKRSEGIFGKEKQKKIVNFFDSIKIDTKGKLYDATAGLPIAVYNTSIEVMKQAALYTAKGAHMIDKAVKYIKENHTGEWDEDKYRADITDKLKASGIKFGKEGIDIISLKKAKLEELERFIENPEEYINKLEERRLKLEEKEAGKSDELKNIEAEIKEKRKILNDLIPKKRTVSKKQELSILDAIEKKSDRLNPKNKDKFLKDVILDVEKEGGLSEQRFKDMYAKALGLDVMTPELSAKIKYLSSSIKSAEEAQHKLGNAYDEVINEDSTENKELLNTAKSEFNDFARKADVAQSELSSILRDKKDFADTLISSIQTNLLTPISLARNIVGVLPDVTMFRPVTNLTAGGIDVLSRTAENLGILSKRTESERISPLARTKGAWLAMPDAARNFYTAVLTGESPNKFGERNDFRKLEPAKAAKRIYDALAGNKKLSAQDWASSIVESTTGFSGSVIGRLLVGPDTFFRTIAEQSKLYEAGTSKGLKGAELEKFVKLPDTEAMEDAKKYADEVTYQGNNKVSKVISSIKSSLKTKDTDSKLVDFSKQTARILGTTLAPYIKTPSNVLWESVKLLYPEISVGYGIKEMKQGNRVAAERHFGQAITGFAVRHVIGDMAAAGIIKPATNYDDKKDRAVEESGGKVGGQFNYSRAMRYFTLQDEGEKPTDVWVDYKWLGPLGLVMGTQASIEKENKESGYIEESGKRATYALKYTSELPYIQSMGTLADAMRDPEKKTNSIIGNTLSTVTSGIVPRTVTQLSQAGTEDKKMIYDKDLGKYIKNKFKYDYFSGGELPSKINIWGEHISNAPKGNDPYAWQVLNFYKDRNPDENSLSYKLQELMEKTDNKDVVPSPPVNSISINKKKVLLNDKEYEDYQTFVGRTRSQMTKAYIDHGSFEQDNDDKKVETLQNIYRGGASQGKNMLISSSKRLSELSGNTSVAGEKRGRGKRRGR